jgi:hypothetical protein
MGLELVTSGFENNEAAVAIDDLSRRLDGNLETEAAISSISAAKGD